jgi:hypothetical protein
MKVRRRAALGLALLLAWPLLAAAERPRRSRCRGRVPPRRAVGRRRGHRGRRKRAAEAAHRAGVERAPALSLLLLRDAESWLEHGDGNTALTLGNAARRSLLVAEPHRLLSRILWNGATAGERTRTVRGLEGVGNRLPVVAVPRRAVAAALLLSLLSVAGLVAAVFVFRALPLLAHLVEEWSGHRLFVPPRG